MDTRRFLTGRTPLVALRLIVGSLLLLPACGLAFAQTPPAATEAFNLRIRCKAMADEKAEAMAWHPLSVAGGAELGMSAAAVDALNRVREAENIGSWHSSKYDAINNRCYVRIYQHTRSSKLETEIHQVYDAQIDDLLANAKIINGKKSGQVWDEYKGPWVPPADCRFCMKGDGWDAAIAYMEEIMTDKRGKQ
jgi:hypothetical protein